MALDCHLAPMDGMSHAAFRSICFEYNTDGACTEMVAAISYARVRRKRMAHIDALLCRRPEEHYLTAQIIGKEPEMMAEAARRIEQTQRFNAVEINMGCPARTVVGSGNGVAIMKDIPLAASIIQSVCNAVSMPVRLKMRLGWDNDHITAPEIARIAEDAGVSAITLHGRTRSQMYCGDVQIDQMRRVRESISIPLYANGAVETAADAAKFAEAVGTNHVCIGRAALKMPWIFDDIKRLERGEAIPERDAKERIGILLRLTDRLCLLKPEKFAICEMRKFSGWYLKGLFRDEEILSTLYRHTEKAPFENALHEYLHMLIQEGELHLHPEATHSLDTNDCYVHKEKKDH